MSEDIQECMCALIAQHGNVLVALATLRQQPKVQQNDEQTNFLGNLVPHINAPAKFNQDMLESTRELHSHLQRKWCATQRTESAGPSKMPQNRSNHLC